MTKKLDFEFLAIDKRLLGKGLSPIELLVYSQIAEFNRNTGDCFISDKALAELFGVSESTVSRAIKALEKLELISRETKNVKGGKERHMYINNSTNVKMTLDSSEQPSKCLLTTVNLTIDNRQNDLIKENIKEKEKDNIGIEETALRAVSSIQELAQEEKEVKYQTVSKREMISLGVPYEIIDESKSLYRIKATNKIVQAI